MKIKKRIISYLLAGTLLLSTTLMVSCDEKEPTNKPVRTIEDSKVLNSFQEIAAIPRSGENYPTLINQAITDKAKEMGYDSEIDEHGNVIIDIPASSKMEDVPLLILECQTDGKIVSDGSVIFNPNEMGASAEKSDDNYTVFAENTSIGVPSTIGISSIFSVMEFLSDKKNNSFKHGPIRALFLANDGTMSGARNLSSSYLEDGDCLISFDRVNDSTITLNSAYAHIYNCNESFNPVDSKARQAYAITAYGFPNLRSGEGSEAPKSLEIISDILTTVNGEGVLFELYSIEAKGDLLTSPTETTAIIGLNEYELRRFKKIFSDTTEAYLDNIDSYYIDNGLNITMTETKTLPTALTPEDTSKVLIHLFGLYNTDFSKDDDNFAEVTINNMSLTSESIDLNVTILSDTINTINSGNEKLDDISKLSELSFRKDMVIPGFHTSSEDPFVSKFVDVYSQIAGGKVSTKYKYTPTTLGFLSGKNSMMPIIAIGVTIKYEDTVYESIYADSLSVPSNTILQFITSLTETEEKSTTQKE